LLLTEVSAKLDRKNIGWLDVRGSIRDVFIGMGGGGWTGGKRLQFKIVAGH